MMQFLKYAYWRWRYAQARRFKYNLEATIHRERQRAQNEVETCEVQMRRAEMAMLLSRADKALARGDS